MQSVSLTDFYYDQVHGSYLRLS